MTAGRSAKSLRSAVRIGAATASSWRTSLADGAQGFFDRNQILRRSAARHDSSGQSFQILDFRQTELSTPGASAKRSTKLLHAVMTRADRRLIEQGIQEPTAQPARADRRQRAIENGQQRAFAVAVIVGSRARDSLACRFIEDKIMDSAIRFEIAQST